MQLTRGFPNLVLLFALFLLVLAASPSRGEGGTEVGKNETAAVATLKNLASAQRQFVAGGHADADNDGTGEFGTFGELAGATGIRGGEKKLVPPLLASAFGRPTPEGHVIRSGYRFAIFLPEKDGKVVADRAEKLWIAYAWPEKQGETGVRTFVVNQTGVVFVTDAKSYSDLRAPAPSAALIPAEWDAVGITGEIADGAVGMDGLKWRKAKVLAPDLKGAAKRIVMAETGALAVLTDTIMSQAHFQACGFADGDRDGTGEFGFYGELSGGSGVRGDPPLRNPVMAKAYKTVHEDGTVRRLGYRFAIHLPGKKGTVVSEKKGGGTDAGLVDPEMAERCWVAYAWPEVAGKTGRVTFVVNQAGDIYGVITEDYSGDEAPIPTAAFLRPKTSPTEMTGRLASGARARDGNVWRKAD